MHLRLRMQVSREGRSEAAHRKPRDNASRSASAKLHRRQADSWLDAHPDRRDVASDCPASGPKRQRHPHCCGAHGHVAGAWSHREGIAQLRIILSCVAQAGRRTVWSSSRAIVQSDVRSWGFKRFDELWLEQNSATSRYLSVRSLRRSPRRFRRTRRTCLCEYSDGVGFCVRPRRGRQHVFGFGCHASSSLALLKPASGQ